MWPCSRMNALLFSVAQSASSRQHPHIWSRSQDRERDANHHLVKYHSNQVAANAFPACCWECGLRLHQTTALLWWHDTSTAGRHQDPAATVQPHWAACITTRFPTLSGSGGSVLPCSWPGVVSADRYIAKRCWYILKRMLCPIDSYLGT